MALADAETVETVDFTEEQTEELIPEAQSAEGEQPETEAAGDEPEMVITIGDEAPPQEDDFDGKPAPVWVKELRREAKEKARRIRELEQELQKAQPAPQAPTLPEKPTLESCGYDEEAFTAKLDQWHEKKRAVDEAKRAAEAEQDKANKAWQAKLAGYEAAKKALKVSDFAEAEENVRTLLTPVQQSVIVNGAKNPALLVYAIDKHPKAKELAAIKDPIEFAFAAARLEAQVQMRPKTQAPAPEKVVRGNVAGAIAVDRAYEKLVEEAQRTGDATKLREFRQQKRAAGK